MVTVQDVKERWEKIQNDDERILFIVGGPGSGKSLLIRELSEQKGWKYLEAKQLIEEEFLLVPRDERPQLAEEVICRALSRSDTEVVLLDGINVFFAPILNLEPFELLKTISKKEAVKKLLNDIDIEKINELSSAYKNVEEHINNPVKYNNFGKGLLNHIPSYMFTIEELINADKENNTNFADILINYISLNDYDKKIAFDLVKKI